MAFDASPEGAGGPPQRGLSKSTVTAVAAAGVGATGSYAIFTIAHLDDIFTKGAGSFAGMFYAFAWFGALGLVAVFMNTQVKDNPQGKFTPISMTVTGLFGLILVVAIGVLGFRAWNAPEMCGDKPCANATKLTTIFDRYADVAGFSFPIDAYPGGVPAIVRASLNDGTPHDFEKNGTLSLDVSGGQKSVTVSVDNLKALEGAYSTLATRYETLLKREGKLGTACKAQVYAAQLSGNCRDRFVALVTSATSDDGADN